MDLVKVSDFIKVSDLGADGTNIYIDGLIKHKSMRKSIKINQEIKEMLLAYKDDGESMDKCVARLISETDAPAKMGSSTRNIHLSEDTYNLLKERKAYGTEPFSSTLLNMLKQVEKQ